jgi:hypothetical protein
VTIPTSCLPTLLIFIHIEHICSFVVAFFSTTIDGRNLIFGHKLHIGLRKMRRKISWTDGRTDRRTEVKQYTPLYHLQKCSHLSNEIRVMQNFLHSKSLYKLHIGTPYLGKRFWTHQIPTSCLPILLIFIHIEHICTFFVAFFSATVDDRNLIFGQKLHIGMISAINSC